MNIHFNGLVYFRFESNKFEHHKAWLAHLQPYLPGMIFAVQLVVQSSFQNITSILKSGLVLWKLLDVLGFFRFNQPVQFSKHCFCLKIAQFWLLFRPLFQTTSRMAFYIKIVLIIWINFSTILIQYIVHKISFPDNQVKPLEEQYFISKFCKKNHQ